MSNKKNLYELYDWRDPICVSHYPFPEEQAGGKDMRRLMELDSETDSEEKALYIHVPFCDKICSFCPFNKILKKADMVEKYITALKKEIDLYSKTKYFKTAVFSAVNFGGGTPSSLEKEQLAEIVTYLKKKINLSEDAVISMEGSVSNFTEEKLKKVLKAGVSRVSFGIQTFQPELRKIMGITKSADRCLELLDNARKIGYKNICIDLMYNLPGQKKDDFLKDIRIAIEKKIDHITLFALCMVPGTKLQKQIINDEVPPVGHQNDEIDMFVAGSELLKEAGYVQYSIWDFALPDKIDKNPYIYYNRQGDLIGMGPAAFGYINRYMYINRGELKEYIETLDRGELPVLVGKKADKKEQMQGMMAKGLRNCKVDKKLFRQLFDCNPEEVFDKEIKQLLEDDLIKVTEDEISLTDRGGVWGNNVSKTFFEKPETFEWRASLAKGKMPGKEKNKKVKDENPDDYQWEEGAEKLLEAAMNRKPAFVRDRAYKDTFNLAAGYAKKEKRNMIKKEDIVKATIESTPPQFRATAINGFRKLGVKMDRYMEKEIKLEVGTNFDNALLKKIKDYPVSVIYGKLPQDFIGGGRPAFALPQISKKKIKKHIALAHKYGIEFNYLLNSVCMDNLELTKKVNKRIIKFLDQLEEWKVDWVTVSIPYLIELVKRHSPNLKVSVSAFANIDSIQKAKHYEELGVDEITLPESYNRNFSFLEELRKSVNIPVRLIATNDCLLSCPFQHFHPIYQSHASQSGHVSKGFPFDFCLLRCTYEKLKDPVNFIKSGWIRPEDTKVYREMGFNNFKLTERLKNTEQIVKMVKAYSEEKWEGNLAEILNVRMSEEDFEVPDFSYLDHPEFADFAKISRAYRLLFSNKVYIDNEKLSGFLDFFRKKEFDCLSKDCDDCGYCKKVAEKSVRLLNENREEDLKSFDEFFDQLKTGTFFKKEGGKVIWSEEIQELFDKMIAMKPEHVQEISRQTIRAEAEALAQKAGSLEVTQDNLIRANFKATPEAVRPMMINGLQEMGINMDKYIE